MGLITLFEQQNLAKMKTRNICVAALLMISSLALSSCGSSGSYSGGGGYRSVNHYHHGPGVWGAPYYGDEVIIIDDGYDIGMPDAVTLPADDW
jgi:hypothetical protein